MLTISRTCLGWWLMPKQNIKDAIRRHQHPSLRQLPGEIRYRLDGQLNDQIQVARGAYVTPGPHCDSATDQVLDVGGSQGVQHQAYKLGKVEALALRGGGHGWLRMRRKASASLSSGLRKRRR
jgi:hypothetical protein